MARTAETILEALALVRKHGSLGLAAKASGIGKSTLQHRLDAGRLRWPEVFPDHTKAGWAAEIAKPKIKVPANRSVAAAGEAPKPDKEFKLEHKTQTPAFLTGPEFSFETEKDNTFTFGACGDQHLGSKYARLDVNEALYDAYAEAGCKVVFNTGNWIDGEARFNVHDLLVHGLEGQCRYLVKHYPQRPNITTYAVAGDDHEGWVAQREGIDIGKYAERTFRSVGRKDWFNLGYMEAPVRLINANSGREAIISVVHPGGGSSYALSYAIQKIIESLDGGEKPSIGLYGHYHKLWSGNIRNVWCVQTGTSQDQTPFMRKKKLEAHVGGYICKATMDPLTGAITRFQTECIRFFNKGFYANRWSHSGDVVQGARVIPGGESC